MTQDDERERDLFRCPTCRATAQRGEPLPKKCRRQHAAPVLVFAKDVATVTLTVRQAEQALRWMGLLPTESRPTASDFEVARHIVRQGAGDEFDRQLYLGPRACPTCESPPESCACEDRDRDRDPA